MNILQIAQLLGPMRFGDVDGGVKLLSIIAPCFDGLEDEKNFVDSRTTGEQFLEIYNQSSIEIKKKVTAISLKQYNEILVEVLDDLIYISNQRELVQRQEQQTRNNQISVICVFLALLATWSVYSYQHHITKTLGISQTSTLLEFGNLIHEIIWPFGEKTPAAQPSEVSLPPPTESITETDGNVPLEPEE